MRFTTVTLFPEMFEPLRSEGVISRALKRNLIQLDTVDLRQFGTGPHKQVDDKPAGGGDGMVLRADVAFAALNSVLQADSIVVMTSPHGKVFDSSMAKNLSEKKHLILMCGRYAGFDQRFIEKHVNLNISIGDFILSGGELPALCIIDATSRFVPGVLGNEKSAIHDSFEDGLLEAPSYTKPNLYDDLPIPQILLEGNHTLMTQYKRSEQLKITAIHRPDLILGVWQKLSKQEQNFVEKIWKQKNK